MDDAWRGAADRLAGSLHKPRVHLSDLLLTICEAGDPTLDRPRVEAQIDAFGREVHARLDRLHTQESSAPDTPISRDLARRELALLTQVLVSEAGFHGDTEDYHDPANSYLSRVIERRRGMPILLSGLFCEVGRRAGITLLGVGLPGHFLLRHAGAQPPLFYDPFDGGRVLAVEELQTVLDRVHSGTVRFHPRMVAAVTPRELAVRVLRNLKGSYLRVSQFEEAFGVTEAIVRLVPEDANEWWDRGRIRLQLQDHLGALDDFTRCIAAEPAEPLRGEVELAIRSVRIVLLQRN